MGEGHPGKGEFPVGTGIHLRGEAIGPADDEQEVPGAAAQLFFQPGGQLQGPEFPAVLVQEDERVSRGGVAQDQFPFLLPDLLFREGRRLLEFRNFDDGKRQVN